MCHPFSGTRVCFALACPEPAPACRRSVLASTASILTGPQPLSPGQREKAEACRALPGFALGRWSLAPRKCGRAVAWANFPGASQPPPEEEQIFTACPAGGAGGLHLDTKGGCTGWPERGLVPRDLSKPKTALSPTGLLLPESLFSLP